MAINRTTKRAAQQQAQQEPEFNDFFEAIKTGRSDVPVKEQEGPDVSAQIQDLIKRVDMLAEQNAALRSYAPPQQAPQIVYAAPPQGQVEDTIPDPVLDAAGYANYILSKANELSQAQIAALRQEQEATTNSNDAYDKLYADFLAVDGNEGYEDHPEWVQVAAMKVTKNLQRRGIDAATYMFQNTDSFYSDVRKALEADFGPLEADGGDDNAGGEDVDRTAGLAGGQPAPINKPAGGGNKPAPDLIGDLTAIQRKGGWY